jgi:hypothetical protein
MYQLSLNALLLLNELLSIGNTITAFSLLLYALTFNLRDRVARAFALLLATVTIAYFGDVLAGSSFPDGEVEMWLRLQWVGISFVPATYMHLSDALLSSTGRPSRGRRSWSVRLSFLASGVTLGLAGLTPYLVGEPQTAGTAVFLQPGPLFPFFALFFFGSLVLAGWNFWRAYQRCLTRVSRRRMAYLMLGAVAPLFAAFPFLTLFGGALIGNLPHLFWTLLLVINISVTGLMVMMAYAVAYFGVAHPDRVVKSRLFQWIMRGPFVASTVAAVTVSVSRVARFVGLEDSIAAPFSMIATLLVLQFAITILRPTLERWLFYGEDRNDIARLHLLEERVLTTGDLRQFLESVLNAVCEICETRSAFVAVIDSQSVELEVAVGPDDPLRDSEELPPMLMTDDRVQFEGLGSVFTWDSYWLIPLYAPNSEELIGVMGLQATSEKPVFDAEVEESLGTMVERAANALSDRRLQREVFGVVDRLVPQVEAIHRMRVAARYAGAEALRTPLEGVQSEADFVHLVRDALAHFWGGPRLTSSPLLRLRVVRDAMQEHDGNAVNALRSTLRRAIEWVRPEGERRFTAEWMLYNILEMKVLEGRKVRDVALRLAMSEADLYRKQRVAFERVARAIAEMEHEVVAKAGERAEGGE